MITPRSVVALLFLLIVAPCQAQDSAWVSLFDGSSLEGWKANESPESFRLEDRVLVVHGPRGHLFYEGPVENASFENFELKAEIKTFPKANSGLFFHTAMQASGWPSVGYEIQVNTTHGDWIKTGSIYSVVNVKEAASRDGEWFELHLKVVGHRVTVKVDGATVVDWVEPNGASGTKRLSKGTFAIQAHDPESQVHYRNIRVRALPAGEATMSRADRYRMRSGEWYQRMDYGPFHTATVEIDGRKNVALKGISIQLNEDRDATVTFDTDLLRMAAGWPGDLSLRGTAYDGAHGPQPKIGGRPIFVTEQQPGVSANGSFEDTRSIPHGPIPDALGRYRGLYRHGANTVLSYDVAGTGVLEHAALETVEKTPVIVRTLSLDSVKKGFEIALADEPLGFTVEDDGHHARSGTAIAKVTPPTGNKVYVIADRTEGEWSDLTMGAPAKNDRADASHKASARFVGPTRAHPAAGVAADGSLARIIDGDVARNNDDTQRNAWYDGEKARLLLDLGEAIDVRRVDTYSWHRTNRSPQRFVLFGADGEKAPSADGDLRRAGWKRIAAVDTRELGEGGKHGSTVINPEGSLGHLRWLLFDVVPVSNREGQFLSEIDVYATSDNNKPVPTPGVRETDAPLHVAILGSPRGVTLKANGNRLSVVFPTDRQAKTVQVALSRGAAADTVKVAAKDLAAMTWGGPSLWPETLEVKAEVSKSKKAYVVDDIPVPFENPWGSNMRIGGFDFFADGERAALCTWNGDVWIVNGIGGDLGTVTWKRYATGLMETLGLRIVDDVIYVNGKDQITRLHDLNGDGEADFYENFNNDVFTTHNFHEFTFDLQTDADGNFYVSKSAPVRGGGRGFEKIVPHHGTVMKISKDGSTREVYSTGLRAPNGIGVGPNGQVTSSDNEGTWVPHCKLHWLKPGSFQGVKDTAHPDQDTSTYNLPLCWFPMSVDNSGGGQVWVPDGRFGPYEGELFHLSYGTSSVFKVMKEEVNGQIQGGVFRLPVRLASSAMRARFNPKDGQLYVCGLRGWQTNANRASAFQRIRYTGAAVAMPSELAVSEDGIKITFTTELDPKLANDPGSYSIKQWNYVWGPQYGSPELSAAHPDEELAKKALSQEMHGVKNHDTLEVVSAKLLPDKKSVLLNVKGLMPVMQMNIKLDLESAEGEEMAFDIYNTIHNIRKSEHH